MQIIWLLEEGTVSARPLFTAATLGYTCATYSKIMKVLNYRMQYSAGIETRLGYCSGAMIFTGDLQHFLFHPPPPTPPHPTVGYSSPPRSPRGLILLSSEQRSTSQCTCLLVMGLVLLLVVVSDTPDTRQQYVPVYRIYE